MIGFDDSQALSMCKSCNATRVAPGGVKGLVDGQYIWVRPRSNVLSISLGNIEHLLRAKCSKRLTTLLSLVH